MWWRCTIVCCEPSMGPRLYLCGRVTFLSFSLFISWGLCWLGWSTGRERHSYSKTMVGKRCCESGQGARPAHLTGPPCVALLGSTSCHPVFYLPKSSRRKLDQAKRLTNRKRRGRILGKGWKEEEKLGRLRERPRGGRMFNVEEAPWLTSAALWALWVLKAKNPN